MWWLLFGGYRFVIVGVLPPPVNRPEPSQPSHAGDPVQKLNESGAASNRCNRRRMRGQVVCEQHAMHASIRCGSDVFQSVIDEHTARTSGTALPS